ncbi:endonuclease/exonuclease/phosphatase family protein [Actinomadura rugatobispora]|uniref:Endonuclease/exonuclease/phosphatase family protein n=1 Tax=Actinomadura rugatobispora TaxID=1994 RepID=A0ABW0ZR31_9ACTN|nr:endonuclease/exonuclease/phosphatase family protein [Actinomadura rugatobispora]
MTVRAEEEDRRTSSAARRIRGRRVWVDVLLWVALAPFAVWAALRVSGWEPVFGWKQLVAFTPYVATVSLVVPLAALSLRRWFVVVVGVLVAGALGVVVVPRALPDANPAADGPRVRVLAANLLAGGVPAKDMADLVRRERPDVLALQEVTPEAVESLDGAGLRESLPYRVLRPSPGVVGSAVYARFPVREQPLIKIGFGQARARVDVPGAPPVEVVSVHPCAPSAPDRAGCWKAGLRALPRADGRGPVRILAGDFNATADHAEFRRLTDSGYRDAADVTGGGLRPTWPAGWRGRVPPVTLDHVLADARAAVRGFEIHRLPGTDHRPVQADLTLPRG